MQRDGGSGADGVALRHPPAQASGHAERALEPLLATSLATCTWDDLCNNVGTDSGDEGNFDLSRYLNNDAWSENSGA